MTRNLLLVCLLCGVTTLIAEPTTLPAIPPPSIGAQTDLEPEVTIKHRDGETLQEYRINGRLYMIKVIPDKGREYFLIDSDGNGSLDARSDQLDPQLMIPSWILFTW